MQEGHINSRGEGVAPGAGSVPTMNLIVTSILTNAKREVGNYDIFCPIWPEHTAKKRKLIRRLADRGEIGLGIQNLSQPQGIACRFDPPQRQVGPERSMLLPGTQRAA